jgi:hypothetical protein
MRVFYACLLAVALASAAQPPRSACSKQTHGRLWPEEANANRALALELMRSGQVYLCSYGRLHYRWEPLSTTLKSLEEDRARKKAGDPPPPTSAPSTAIQPAGQR